MRVMIPTQQEEPRIITQSRRMGRNFSSAIFDEAVDGPLFSQEDLDAAFGTGTDSTYTSPHTPPHHDVEIPPRLGGIDWIRKWQTWLQCREDGVKLIRDIETNMAGYYGPGNFGMAAQRDAFDAAMYELLFVRRLATHPRVSVADSVFNLVNERWTSVVRYDAYRTTLLFNRRY